MIWKGKANEGFVLSCELFSHKSFVFLLLRPFSYARKKKDQKEARPSAGGRFFHELPQRHTLAAVSCVRMRPKSTSMLDGIAWKNPPYPRSPIVKCIDGERSRIQIGIRISNAKSLASTSRAGRVIPYSIEDWIVSEVRRPEDPVHPVRVFAPCITQAPRPAATFGSFWSLQKEHAVGREFGEKGILNLVLFLILADG